MTLAGKEHTNKMKIMMCGPRWGAKKTNTLPLNAENTTGSQSLQSESGPRNSNYAICFDRNNSLPKVAGGQEAESRGGVGWWSVLQWSREAGLLVSMVVIKKIFSRDQRRRGEGKRSHCLRRQCPHERVHPGRRKDGKKMLA